MGPAANVGAAVLQPLSDAESDLFPLSLRELAQQLKIEHRIDEFISIKIQ
jgi:hypothetical protein